MPRVPGTSKSAAGIRKVGFEAFARKLKERAASGDLIPLHIGDTHLPPPPASLRVDLADPELQFYCPVTGEPEFRDATAADLTRSGYPVDAKRVFATPGATGGLDNALDAIVDPGEEVLVLTPSWPLILGLIQRKGCTPVEVDVAPDGHLLPADEVAQRVRAAVTERTAALYFCHPNNPCGFLYDPEHLRALDGICAELGLWRLIDVVYHDMIYDLPERPLAPLVGASSTFLVASYSKAFSLAGQRVGVLAAPEDAAGSLAKIITHSTYHASRVAQRMARAALEDGGDEARAQRAAFAKEGARITREVLTAVPFPDPRGGAFIFLDLRPFADDDQAALDLLEAALDRGVSLTPGSAFGHNFGRFARLCLTATSHPQLMEGVQRLQTFFAERG